MSRTPWGRDVRTPRAEEGASPEKTHSHDTRGHLSSQFTRAPHKAGPPANHPHAALLIDFDNVTMGIRSDLTKELKNLLNSDIIKGKVAVQRAYADWRRYPQYIVPLAESSVDLIFAPAYGSTKKNATDIRLAIDALELIFTRPEIGTFILLSGDSDFSSLVLKLKEYGKYVIGVGIRESASDLLVQNCDEYYSYSALTGLTRAGEETSVRTYDPWELVEVAVRQMIDNRDVMRSDRLKQVLIELDPNFDEKTLGFSKFNRFVQECANRGLLKLHKLENGQFEIQLADAEPVAEEPKRSRRARRREEPKAEAKVEAEAEPEVATPAAAKRDGREVREAFDLVRRATEELARNRGASVRDSDVKRRMLEINPEFDESEYGFAKFSRFLHKAHDAEVITLQKLENGNYEVLPTRPAAEEVATPKPSKASVTAFDPEALGLPMDAEAIINYMVNSYTGVGRKSAEALVGTFGADKVFESLHTQPERVREVLPGRRGESVLEAWQADLTARREAAAEEPAASAAAEEKRPRRARGRRGGRGRSRKRTAAD